MTYLQSILLISSDPIAALNSKFDINLDKHSLDLHLIQSDKAIGIDAVRDAKHFASSPPVKDSLKQIVVIDAHKLTLTAQNAFLKLLEEPPSYLQIILTAIHTHPFLETLLSRCQIITANYSAKTNSSSDMLSSLINLPAAKRLDILPPTTTKIAAVDFCHQLISSATDNLRAHPTKTSAQNLNTLLTCLSRLNQNTNPTLTVTDAILSLLPHRTNPATITQSPE